MSMHDWYEWSVGIDVVGPAPIEDPETIADELLTVLEELAPAVSVGSSRVGVHVAVEAESALTAIDHAISHVDHALEKIGLHGWAVSSVEAMTGDELEDRLAEPNVPTLLGVSEIAELLGVSKQRVSELYHRGTLPAPVAELAAGPVWAEPTVLRFVETWERRPGRPRASDLKLAERQARAALRAAADAAARASQDAERGLEGKGRRVARSESGRIVSTRGRSGRFVSRRRDADHLADDEHPR